MHRRLFPAWGSHNKYEGAEKFTTKMKEIQKEAKAVLGKV